MRKAVVVRKTKEVEISVDLNIDGTGESQIETNIKFLNHLLTTLTKHSLFDLSLQAKGDLKHHVTEDVALALGESVKKALEEGKGIRRFGTAYVSMDESLARAVIDLGGRPYAIIDLNINQPKIEDLIMEDIEHFFTSFAQSSKINLHLTVLYGSNEHHKIEAAIKAMALALREAAALEPRIIDRIPSAKGVL
ncbi:MAG: imidazoleglycerol-phosphate dehydratase HisB [Candidatus Bathyarchaeota archaeon]|nr:MAG: imidazoleglycerol-phosphate dehydratase HisB [Candidatus Bathyarchaeota archaeon]